MTRFQRLFSRRSCRAMVLCAVVPVVWSQGLWGMAWNPPGTVLGQVNYHGHAQMSWQLGSWQAGERELPVWIVWRSDPEVEPGAFGPGWEVPLFASTLQPGSASVWVWQTPGGKREYLRRSRTHETERSGPVYMSQDGRWRGQEERGGRRLRITSTSGAEQWYAYDEGRLREFQVAGDSAVYRVDYTGRGQPRHIENLSTREKVVEVIYRGSTELRAIRVSGIETAIETGRGDWLSPDGHTPYSNMRVNYLSSLQIGEGSKEEFSYKDGGRHERVFGGRAVAVRLNRLELRRDGEERGWIEFESRSGFAVADSGGSYVVSSPGLHPEDRESWERHRNSRRIAPVAVDIRRQVPGGLEGRWSYDYAKGERVWTDPAGVLWRRTRIVSPGPAYGKERRRERQEGNRWVTVQQMAYDPQGRLIRRIGENATHVWQWQEVDGYERRQEFVDGALVREEVYRDGDLIRAIEPRDGGTFFLENRPTHRILGRHTAGGKLWAKISDLKQNSVEYDSEQNTREYVILSSDQPGKARISPDGQARAFLVLFDDITGNGRMSLSAVELERWLQLHRDQIEFLDTVVEEVKVKERNKGY